MIPIEILTLIARESRNPAMIHQLTSSDSAIVEFYRTSPFTIMEYMIENGHLSLIERLYKLVEFDYRRWMFYPAIKSGVIETIEWLRAHDLVMIRDPIGVAVRYGQLGLIEPLMKLGYRPTEESVAKAAAAGNIDAIKKLTILGVPTTESAIYKAAKYGHLDVIEYLNRRGVSSIEHMLNGAIKGDRVNVFEKIFHRLAGRYDNIARIAASARCNNIIKFLHSMNVRLPPDTIDFAAKGGSLELVAYLMDHGHIPSSSTIYQSIQGGNLDVIKLVSTGNAVELSLRNLIQSVRQRLVRDNIDGSSEVGRLIVRELKRKLLFRNVPPIHVNNDAIDYIVQRGLLNEITNRPLEEWSTVVSIQHVDYRLLYQLLIVAIERGNLPFIRQCLDETRINYSDYSSLIKYAVIHGQLETLRYLVDNFNQPLDSSLTFNASEGGYLRTLQFLHQHGLKSTTDDLEVAALRGHLPIVKLLHENGIELTRGSVFNATTRGHLEIVIYMRQFGIQITNDIMYELIYNNSLSVLVYINEQLSILQETDPLFIAILNKRLSILKYMFNDLITSQHISRESLARILHHSVPGIDYLIERVIGSCSITVAEYIMNVIRPLI